MFTLTEEEKISFLTVVYNIIMFDDHIDVNEKEILDSLQKEVFNLEKFPKIKLETESEIAGEINKITKVTFVIYLFNILYELAKYHKAYEKNNNREDVKSEFINKLNSILDKITYRDEIKKSKLFNYDNSFKPNELTESGQTPSINTDKIKGFLNNIFKQ